MSSVPDYNSALTKLLILTKSHGVAKRNEGRRIRHELTCGELAVETGLEVHIMGPVPYRRRICLQLVRAFGNSRDARRQGAALRLPRAEEETTPGLACWALSQDSVRAAWGCAGPLESPGSSFLEGMPGTHATQLGGCNRQAIVPGIQGSQCRPLDCWRRAHIVQFK